MQKSLKKYLAGNKNVRTFAASFKRVRKNHNATCGESTQYVF